MKLPNVFRSAVRIVCFLALPLPAIGFPPESPSHGPTMLCTDGLVQPLGIDTTHPLFSWKLQDAAAGARQTAYRIRVYSGPARVSASSPDIWDSGRISSDVSTGVRYGGPALLPSTRYYWRVQVWGNKGISYAESSLTWWETGLMGQDHWRGQWIGHEGEELHALRTANAQWITNASSSASLPEDTVHAFRFHFPLRSAVRRAVLYATGEDSVAAWLNGKPALELEPMAPWGNLPWGTYRSVEVGRSLQQGDNLLALQVTRYRAAGKKEASALAPMSASLYVEFADGSDTVFRSEAQGWKATVHPAAKWWTATFDDAGWAPAVPYIAERDTAGPSTTTPPWPTGPVALLRKEFEEKSPVVSARLYATALGFYELHLNGRKVGDQLLTPGWTDYRDHVPYQVFDVTDRIHVGPNAIAAYLAPGWYSTPLLWIQQSNNYGNTQPALLAQLRLTHADGTVEWVSTDSSWKAAQSSILQAELYNGQTRDARLEIADWDLPNASTAGWSPVTSVEPKVPRIVAQDFEPIRTHAIMSAKRISSPSAGVYILDFGQNMSAIPRLTVTGRAGDSIQLRFGEVLNQDGSLYTANLRTAKATDRFTLAGHGTEVFEPQFTFHGFRYAEIIGLRQAPTAGTLQAVVIHTDAPFTARFSTGNAMVNQLWSNVLWGQRSNFVGVPSDCPQRDERLGWMADAQVFWRTAAFNMDVGNFSRKYSEDMRHTRSDSGMYSIFAPGTATPFLEFGAAWSDAGIIIPWTAWIQTGDTRVVDENWEAMRKYLAAIESENPNHLWRNDFGTPFGDWLTPTITTPQDIVTTAYWAYDASLMSQMAAATGRTDEAAAYSAIFEKIKAAFQSSFVHEDGFVGAPNTYPGLTPPSARPPEQKALSNELVETQTGYVLALHMKLLPDSLRARAAERLVGLLEKNHWSLGTGFLGTPYLLEVLSDTGHSDVAYRLLLNSGYPSWGYLIEHGATTMWERWNGDLVRDDPSMNSYNHYAYGAVAEWLYRYAAGIDTQPDAAGFKAINLHPQIDRRLGHLDFDYDSPLGTITSHWAVTGNRIVWRVVVPPNATAVVSEVVVSQNRLRLLPSTSSPVRSATATDGYRLPAGHYTFAGILPR